jgi:hypothetical protein
MEAGKEDLIPMSHTFHQPSLFLVFSQKHVFLCIALAQIEVNKADFALNDSALL